MAGFKNTSPSPCSSAWMEKSRPCTGSSVYKQSPLEHDYVQHGLFLCKILKSIVYTAPMLTNRRISSWCFQNVFLFGMGMWELSDIEIIHKADEQGTHLCLKFESISWNEKIPRFRNDFPLRGLVWRALGRAHSLSEKTLKSEGFIQTQDTTGAGTPCAVSKSSPAELGYRCA